MVKVPGFVIYKVYSFDMPEFTTFLSHRFYQTVNVLGHMARPEGTTIEALCRHFVYFGPIDPVVR